MHWIAWVRAVGLWSSIWFVCAWIGAPALAQEIAPPCTARIESIQGQISIQQSAQEGWQAGQPGACLPPGAMVRVAAFSRAAVVLQDHTVLRLDQNSTLRIPAAEKPKPLWLELLEGAAHFFSRTPRQLKVVTPFLNASIEGTEFFVRVGSSETFLTIFEGQVLATNVHGEQILTQGQSAVAQANQAPVLKVLADPRQSVHWTLHYPPIFKSKAPGAYQAAWQRLAQNDLQGAMEALERLPAQDRKSEFYLARASLLLAGGRAAEATVDLDQVLAQNPQDADALGLKAMLAVVQGRKAEALELASQAVSARPDSAAAHLALSYARQAGFDIPGALAAVAQAATTAPQNALVKARLAELYLSTGELDKALNAAEQAVALDPNIARTQSVLGFARLTQIKTQAARQAFERAMALDPADPLPRLGMGLAIIRDGDVETGREQIEVAAALDPGSALIRSYLGKAYFEEKRDKHAASQLTLAKQLDPNDPTPWFYDAIRKQTENRPVEALQDLQKSIELNDNRAVYRSRLLLDSDEAARSASLARIYSDLGFQQRALVEGWNSVNTDPANFSAHRFLADSYSVLPRHEIARVSELLQSQLLQPLNITPIQPRLGESNQFLISAGGPAGLSFNEFNPLFNRNRIAFQGSGLAGENGAYGGEGVVSGIYNRLSMSAGYTHFETDGWRDNASQDDDIANFFAQYELSYKTSVQAEYRYRDTESGDLQQIFFKDEFLPNYEEDEEKRSIRLGFHHTFAPGSDLIGNFQYSKLDLMQHNESPDPEFTLAMHKVDLKEDDTENLGSELSYLLRSKYLNLVSGAGYFDKDSKDEFSVIRESPDSPPVELIQVEADTGVKHTNLYAYSYIKPQDNLILTIGATYDDFNPDDENGFKDRNQFNPKFGLTWNPFQNTTLRAAAFRVLKRTLVTDQTLEPTQIAGFNQFFDEIPATDYWVYGGALDLKFTKVFLGAEYTYRDLDVPFRPRTGLTTVIWEEQIFRTYLFWTPHEWLALDAQYIFEDIDRDQNWNFNAKAVETHYFPLGINFFHPCGISASLKGTYVDQEGSFNRLDAPQGVTENGQDDFWLFDAAIRYRFPKRYGFFTMGVSNLTDEDFQYFNADRDNPRIQPDRSFFALVTLALP